MAGAGSVDGTAGMADSGEQDVGRGHPQPGGDVGHGAPVRQVPRVVRRAGRPRRPGVRGLGPGPAVRGRRPRRPAAGGHTARRPVRRPAGRRWRHRGRVPPAGDGVHPVPGPGRPVLVVRRLRPGRRRRGADKLVRVRSYWEAWAYGRTHAGGSAAAGAGLVAAVAAAEGLPARATEADVAAFFAAAAPGDGG